uniref:Uncharacterized protein n=1 Tax=Ditylenchus dipsaci TaxID=166011 RepID=A0A915DYL6_9BILA
MAQQTVINSHTSEVSSKTTIENTCSTELAYLFSDKSGLKNKNVLVGCKIKSTDVLWSPMSFTLAQLVEIISNETAAVLKCERLSYFDDNMTSVYIPYSFQANAQPQPNTFTLACLQPGFTRGHLTLLYATIAFDSDALNQENNQY